MPMLMSAGDFALQVAEKDAYLQHAAYNLLPDIIFIRGK